MLRYLKSRRLNTRIAATMMAAMYAAAYKPDVAM
jgi:hypothetical protein